MRITDDYVNWKKSMQWRNGLAVLLLSLLLVPAGAGSSSAFSTPGELDENRAKILAYAIRQQLPRHHYSHKEIDDELSRSAFALYLKQLDFQKRFLLRSDVEKLREYENSLDDEVNLGKIVFPTVASGLHRTRVEEAREMVRELLAQPFDHTKKEYIETDPEKKAFCETRDMLRERWRLTLKYQAMNRFLNLEEDQAQEDSSGDREKKSGEILEEDEPEVGESPETEKKKSPLELRAEARKKVLKSYEDLFDRLLKDTPGDFNDRYYNAVARAFDPHTNYLPPEKKEDFDISMRGSLEGIGALLRQEDGYIKVVRVIPGSAAYRQGDLQAEDVVLKVAEGPGEPVDVTDMKLRDAVGLIRGKKGTEVRLTVKHSDGARAVIPIIRDVVEIEETFVKSAVMTAPEADGEKIGYIKIPSFYRDFENTRRGGDGRNSTADVRAELEKFRKDGVGMLILDLRNNGGGALTDAVNIAGLFIDEGPVVQVRSSNGHMKILSDTEEGVVFDGPMVVLVNKFSASASEILAGALQDYGRAVIMGGEHTHGKGTVQTLIDLNRTVALPNIKKYGSLGALKVTIQKFYRVSGASTQFRGVVPDLVLPDRFQHMKTGEQYLEHPLPWDTVSSADFKPWNETPRASAEVMTASATRVDASEAFNKMAAESSRAQERRENTRRSLHIDEMRQEREEEIRRKDPTPGAGMHGVEESVEGAKKGRLTESERQEAWLKGVREDPYVIEGMSVLRDISAASAPVAGGASAPAAEKM